MPVVLSVVLVRCSSKRNARRLDAIESVDFERHLGE